MFLEKRERGRGTTMAVAHNEIQHPYISAEQALTIWPLLYCCLNYWMSVWWIVALPCVCLAS